MSAEQLRLEIDWQVTETELTLHYRVHNDSRQTAWLLNRLWQGTPAMSLSPNIIYVALEPDTRTVRLSKELAELPRDRAVTAPVAPFVTPVRPGEQFQEAVRLALPLKQYQQYGNERPGDRLVRYEHVLFCLGFYWGVAGVTEVQRQIGDATVVMPTFPPGSRPVFDRLCTRPRALAVPVVEPLK